jgi:hypothetical protein
MHHYLEMKCISTGSVMTMNSHEDHTNHYSKHEAQTGVRICSSLAGNSYNDIVIRLCQRISQRVRIVQH